MSSYDKTQVEAILSFVNDLEIGRKLSGSERRYKLLRYIVQAELENRSGELKAYAIALDVLGRGKDFDPATDSIVRVEMARLRDALELFYATTENQSFPLILVPKGTYRPSISFASSSKAKTCSRRIPVLLFVATALTLGVIAIVSQLTWKTDLKVPPVFAGPRVAALPFENLGGSSDAEDFAYGLEVDTIAELSRFHWLSVFIVLEKPKSIKELDNIDYILTGTVRADPSSFVAIITLLEAESGKVLWSRKYDRPRSASNLLSVQGEAALEIAREIARPEGQIASLESRKVVRDTTLSDSAYACIFLLYKYWRDFTEETHLKVRDCLDKAIVRAPDYAEAHGAMAFMYIDEARKQYNERDGYDPWERAFFHAHRGYELNPKSAIAAQALFTYYSRTEDLENFRRIGNVAIEDSPNNPEILADYGNKLAINLGQLKEGAEIANRALDLNRSPPGWYYISPAVQAYADGHYQTALEYADKIQYVAPIYAYAVSIASSVRLSDEDAYLEYTTEFIDEVGMSLEETIAYIEDVWGDDKVTGDLNRDISIAFAAHAMRNGL